MVYRLVSYVRIDKNSIKKIRVTLFNSNQLDVILRLYLNDLGILKK